LVVAEDDDLLQLKSVIPQAPASGATSESAHITIRGLNKEFNGTVIYENFDLDIPRGRFVTVFGPNGCGKSTLINLISGLIPTDGGEILFGGKRLAQTKIGYVFQNYREALFPWMTAFSNIEYPLALMKIPKRERVERVQRLVDHLGVRLDLKLYPYQMSGGQQQLVSIMRALVVEPEVLFLDEPFSALDYEMSLFMRDQLQRIFHETRTTTVLVSHDLEEAVYLADYVLLLTRRPARIADYRYIELARHRGDDTLAHPDFIEHKRYCLEVFQREVRRQ
jgi:NitT/TauT family transport system ATP-binding protein